MIVIIIAVAVFLIGALLYNNLIGKKNQVEYAYSTIDAMLKKRFDLLPNLVETVKQYMTYEQDTLTKIVGLRENVKQNPNMPVEQRMETEDKISDLLGRVRIAVENYPDLKADGSFKNLQAVWTETEEQLAAARRTYNAAVTSYNNTVEMFPTNVVAGMMNYQRMAVLVTPEVERQAPSAKELFKD